MFAAPMADVQAAAVDALQPAWLAVSMNGVAHGDVLVLRGKGDVFVAVEALLRWGISIDGLPIVDLNHQPHVALAASGLNFTVEESSQTLTLSIPPARLPKSAVRLGHAPNGTMARSGWGGFLNYNLLASRTADGPALSGYFEAGVFSPYGSGTSTFVGQSANRTTPLVRLESSWTVDDPDRLRSLRIGDSIGRGGIGGTPFRFGGVQFGRSFETQPGFVTLPLPSLSGSATLPSVADLYVDNVLTGRHDISPGPFAINDVPVISGSGQVSLVVRDILGQETTVTQSYYTAPTLLRAGLDDYSVEAGFARHNFGTRSFDYGPFFAAGSYRYGISSGVTGEGHIEITGAVQQAGIGADFVVPGAALVKLGAATSQSPDGTGTMVSLGVARNTPRISYGAMAELLSDDYVSYGTSLRSPRRSIMAYIGMPTPFGSLGGSFTSRSYRDSPTLNIASLNTQIRVTRFGSLSLIATKTWGAVAETTAQVMFALPLGRNTAGTAGIGTNGGRQSATVTVQRNLPIGNGIGYRLGGEVGEIDRLDGELALQTGFGTYTIDGSWSDQTSAAHVSAAGSVGIVDGTVFAARALTQSFAAVRVGNYPGVGVYADNQLVGRTGSNGMMIIPNLRTFDDNPISIDSDDVPMTAQIRSNQQIVRPPRRAGVRVDFPVLGRRDALLTVRLEDGSVLPTGLQVETASGEETVSGAAGEIYLSMLDDHNRVTVRLPDAACSFDVALPPGNAAQPRLGPFTCVRTMS